VERQKGSYIINCWISYDSHCLFRH
jgi:hypothetical protein